MCCLHYRGRIGGNKSSLTKIRKVLWPRPSYSLMTIANRWYGSYPWWWSWWWWFVNFTDSNLRQTADIALLSPAFLPTFLAAFQIEVTLAFHVCVCVCIGPKTSIVGMRWNFKRNHCQPIVSIAWTKKSLVFPKSDCGSCMTHFLLCLPLSMLYKRKDTTRIAQLDYILGLHKTD